jgi:AcrR family transcriptional regulator
MAEDDTRSKILNAAGEAFAESGFEAATVRKICEQAGVNLASINYYFGDKAGLYVEAIKYAHRFREQQVPLPEWPPGTPARVRLRDFVHTTVQRLLVARELPWQAQLMFREITNPTGACQQLAQDIFRPHFNMLLGILKEMAPKGTEEERLYRLGFSVIGQCVFYKLHRPVIGMLVPEGKCGNLLDAEELADFITEMVLRAINK